jgi:hypothetical protein
MASVVVRLWPFCIILRESFYGTSRARVLAGANGDACHRGESGRDVVAHARERIAAALILVAFNAWAAFLLARDPNRQNERGPPTGAGNSLTRLRLLAKMFAPRYRLSGYLGA